MSQPKEAYPKTWEDYQEVYERLQSQESNRLTISSFLGGLTFASFAAFESSPIKNSLARLDAQSVFALGTALLLGISTLIFLAVAVGAYQAIRHFSHISQESVDKLQSRDNTSDTIPEALTTERTGADNKVGNDLERIKSAWNIHEESDKAISIGFAFLIFALVLIGFEVNYSVGIIVIVGLLVLLYYFKTLRNMLGGWFRSKISK
ncbi:MAG: hypothetical protein PXY39_05300 [archaeon]|nr:hypothetical protein [archaeon]